MSNKPKSLFIAISSMVVVLFLLLTACSPWSYDDGYAKGFQERDGEGLEKGEILPAPGPTIILEEITPSDAEDVLNLRTLLPAGFDKVDAANKGISNADLGLGDDFSEVQLFIRDEPFQMIYAVAFISDSRIDRASMDIIMNNETLISNLIIENVKAGALQEGYELEDVELKITYPDLGDMAFLGEGHMSSVGLEIGFDAIWFRSNTMYIMLHSTYYTSKRYTQLPIANELERRISQFSQ